MRFTAGMALILAISLAPMFSGCRCCNKGRVVEQSVAPCCTNCQPQLGLLQRIRLSKSSSVCENCSHNVGLTEDASQHISNATTSNSISQSHEVVQTNDHPNTIENPVGVSESNESIVPAETGDQSSVPGLPSTWQRNEVASSPQSEYTLPEDAQWLIPEPSSVMEEPASESSEEDFLDYNRPQQNSRRTAGNANHESTDQDSQSVLEQEKEAEPADILILPTAEVPPLTSRELSPPNIEILGTVEPVQQPHDDFPEANREVVQLETSPKLPEFDSPESAINAAPVNEFYQSNSEFLKRNVVQQPIATPVKTTTQKTTTQPNSQTQLKAQTPLQTQQPVQVQNPVQAQPPIQTQTQTAPQETTQETAAPVEQSIILRARPTGNHVFKPSNYGPRKTNQKPVVRPEIDYSRPSSPSQVPMHQAKFSSANRAPESVSLDAESLINEPVEFRSLPAIDLPSLTKVSEARQQLSSLRAESDAEKAKQRLLDIQAIVKYEIDRRIESGELVHRDQLQTEISKSQSNEPQANPTEPLPIDDEPLVSEEVIPSGEMPLILDETDDLDDLDQEFIRDLELIETQENKSFPVETTEPASTETQSDPAESNQFEPILVPVPVPVLDPFRTFPNPGVETQKPTPTTTSPPKNETARWYSVILQQPNVRHPDRRPFIPIYTTELGPSRFERASRNEPIQQQPLPNSDPNLFIPVFELTDAGILETPAGIHSNNGIPSDEIGTIELNIQSRPIQQSGETAVPIAGQSRIESYLPAATPERNPEIIRLRAYATNGGENGTKARIRNVATQYRYITEDNGRQPVEQNAPQNAPVSTDEPIFAIPKIRATPIYRSAYGKSWRYVRQRTLESMFPATRSMKRWPTSAGATTIDMVHSHTKRAVILILPWSLLDCYRCKFVASTTLTKSKDQPIG